MRNLALILPVGPGLLVGRRIEVVMGVDQFCRRGLRRRFAATQSAAAPSAAAPARNCRRDPQQPHVVDNRMEFLPGLFFTRDITPSAPDLECDDCGQHDGRAEPLERRQYFAEQAALSSVANSGSRFMISALRNGPMRTVETYKVKIAIARPR